MLDHSRVSVSDKQGMHGLARERTMQHGGGCTQLSIFPPRSNVLWHVIWIYLLLSVLSLINCQRCILQIHAETMTKHAQHTSAAIQPHGQSNTHCHNDLHSPHVPCMPASPARQWQCLSFPRMRLASQVILSYGRSPHHVEGEVYESKGRKGAYQSRYQ